MGYANNFLSFDEKVSFLTESLKRSGSGAKEVFFKILLHSLIILPLGIAIKILLIWKSKGFYTSNIKNL